ncbi:MAG: hypothetical protein IJ681_02080 [Bacteroidales bacterium]|nr:hypothetical protein [Bacteroidales bacterium]
MTKTYLLPNKVRIYGWIVLIITAILFILCLISDQFMDIEFKMPAIYDDLSGIKIFNSSVSSDRHWFVMADTSIFTTIIPSLFIIGAILVVFSKEKVEDELTCKIREQSLVWAIEVGFTVLLIAYLFFYGISFLFIRRFVVDLFLVLFFCKFRFEIYRLKKEVGK